LLALFDFLFSEIARRDDLEGIKVEYGRAEVVELYREVGGRCVGWTLAFVRLEWLEVPHAPLWDDWERDETRARGI